MSKLELGELFVCLAPSLRDMKDALDGMLPNVAQLEQLAEDRSVDATLLIDAANVSFEDLKNSQLRMAKDLSEFVRSKGMDFSDFVDGAAEDMMAAGTPQSPALHVVDGGREK